MAEDYDSTDWVEVEPGSVYRRGVNFSTKYTKDEILKGVIHAVAKSVDLDEEDVQPASLVRRELGAESIDMSDLELRLERHFAMRIEGGLPGIWHAGRCLSANDFTVADIARSVAELLGDRVIG